MVNIIMLGNPGAGKSTLLSSLVEGTTTFNSGINIGRGKTIELQVVQFKGNSYIDSPGLSDVKLREKAAAEIEKAFKLGGEYKVFFVVTLESGRVRPDDVATMKLVLEAVPDIGHNQYSIIINKMSPSVEAILTESEEERKELAANLAPFSGQTNTNAIFYVPLNQEWEDKANKWSKLSPDLLNFIDKSPSIPISPQRVHQIKYSQFDSIIVEVQEVLSQLQADNAALRREMAEREEQLRNLYQSSTNTKSTETVILIGNEMGQILNLLVGESVKHRRRRVLQKAVHQGTTYLFTLQLNNGNEIERAVKYLEQELSRGGNFKLDPQYPNKILPKDLFLIQQVLKAAIFEGQNDNYSIIINKMKQLHVTTLQYADNRMSRLLPGIEPLSTLLLIPAVPPAADRTELVKFIEEAPEIYLSREGALPTAKWYYKSILGSETNMF